MRASCLQGQKLEAEGATAACNPEKSADNPRVFDFWGVANALADSVKKTTADISARYLLLFLPSASQAAISTGCECVTIACS